MTRDPNIAPPTVEIWKRDVLHSFCTTLRAAFEEMDDFFREFGRINSGEPMGRRKEKLIIMHQHQVGTVNAACDKLTQFARLAGPDFERIVNHYFHTCLDYDYGEPETNGASAQAPAGKGVSQ